MKKVLDKKNYDLICNKIINSKEYIDYVVSITDDMYKEFPELFKCDEKVYNNALKDITFMQTFSKYVLNKEEELNKIIFNCLESYSNVFNKITCKKFMETYVGDLNKDDLNEVDVLFPLIEAIFGLDNLLESVENINVLEYEFNRLYGQDIEYFNEFFENLYNECKNKKYDEMIEIVRNYDTTLSYYIGIGMANRVNEVENDETKNFRETNILYNNIIRILGDKSLVVK